MTATLRYQYIGENGKEKALNQTGDIVPAVGTVVSVYSSRPGIRNQVEPELQLRVTGPSEIRYINGLIGTTVDIIVPCELVK